MKIHSICLRKKLLGGLSEKWGSPMSIEAFIRKYPDGNKRQSVIDEKKDIVFFDDNQEEIPYEDAVKFYQDDERSVLEYFMAKTIKSHDFGVEKK